MAQEFDAKVGISGVVLTRMDGDGRGGAALSMRAVTGKPIRFVGLGEKMDALETFEPERIAAEIRKFFPDFTMDYDVDPVRQGIADSWPNSMDDSCAREEWGWKPEYDLAAMTKDMLEKLQVRFDEGKLKYENSSWAFQLD